MNNHPGIINNRFHLGLLIHLANQFKDQLISQHFSGMDITAAQFKVLISIYKGFNSRSKSVKHGHGRRRHEPNGGSNGQA